MAWEIITKKNDCIKPYIGIYPNHVMFNTGTTRLYELEKYERVVLMVDNDKKRIGFKFSTDPDEPKSFSLTRSNNHLTIYTKKLTQGGKGREWLREKLQLPAIERRYTPRYDTKEKILTINIL